MKQRESYLRWREHYSICDENDDSLTGRVDCFFDVIMQFLLAWGTPLVFAVGIGSYLLGKPLRTEVIFVSVLVLLTAWLVTFLIARTLARIGEWAIAQLNEE